MTQRVSRAIVGTVVGVLVLAGCSSGGQQPGVAPSGGEDGTAGRRTAMAIFGPIDPYGDEDPQACLEYPPWVAIDRSGSPLSFLLEDGWVRMPAGSVLAHLDRTAEVDRAETGAVAQIGLLRPSEVPDATALRGSSPATPVHRYVVERLQAHGGRYDELFVQFVGRGRYAGIAVAGVTSDGEVEFVMDCGASHSSWLREHAGELAPTMSPAGLLEELLRHPDGEVARTVGQPERPPTKAEAWQRIPAGERPLDPDITPAAVLEPLEEVAVWYDLPDSWTAIDAVLCPKIAQGWSTCAALGSGVTSMQAYVDPGRPVEWMLLDAGPTLDAPLASLGTVEADRLLERHEPGMAPVLRASVPATSVQGLVTAAEEHDGLFQLEWARIDQLEAELVDPINSAR